MSIQYGKLLSLILLEHFGETIQTVGEHLFKNGSCSLRSIVQYTELPVGKVKLALCVLLKQRFAKFKLSDAGLGMLYHLEVDNVLLILRYPRFVAHIKKLFGEVAEILIEETLTQGYAKPTEIIINTAKRLKGNQNIEPNLTEIRDKFITLVTAEYVMTYGVPNEEDSMPIFFVKHSKSFTPPEISVSHLKKILDGSDSEVPEIEQEMYWCLNFDRFHQDFRDDLLINGMGKRIDANAGELIRIMIQQMYIRTQPWENVSNSISFLELQDVTKKLNSNAHIRAYLDHYLTVIMEDDSGFLSRVGDSSGGQYRLNLKDAITQLCWCALENIVLEKFHSKAARIFRLVRKKKFIEPENVHSLAMINTKEAKHICYQLLEANFLQLQEIRKSQNLGPVKSFTLFYINPDHVIPMALEMCYKSLYNLMTRKNYNKMKHNRVIEKKRRVDTISMSLKVQGAAEEMFLDIEEMITPVEKETLEKIGKLMKTLTLADLEIDNTMFLFQLYCKYNKL